MPELTIMEIQVFLLAFIRITIFLHFMPLFDQSFIPVQVRAGLAFFLVVILFNSIYTVADLPLVSSLWEFAGIVIREMILGMLVGYLFRSLFAAVSFAGRVVDMQLGFAMLQIPDPILEGEQTSATGMLQLLVFALVFLISQGHYYLFLAIEHSFHIIPPGEIVMAGDTLFQIALFTIVALTEMALRLALPLMAILMITSMTLGVVAKTMPQMNVFFVGMPLKILIGFSVLVVLLPILTQIFQQLYMQLYRDIWGLLNQLGGR
ncbi:flagellar biosynthetic protein FliR [Chitinivibrio alkaliphilus]|uniref:Flagellar biosynthetic protein FliR n=1 Tax=Chitinivibrio alkaliphilus ACht1 TaxID=1313304 RepID=U7DCP4_9BACT|nr:flagellar biosynthetic protein FliR [Chitinivibrio alkaliphilus]ERP39328.1 flagellar biosynthetic protein FliR [Chitinivibrio alkaliphilus ACht1]